MADRKSFLVRIDPEVLEAIRHWADDDLRSVNGQIEFILRRALKDAGRLRKRNKKPASSRNRKDSQQDS